MSDATLKPILDEMGNLTETLREYARKAADQEKAFGRANSETVEALDKINARMDALEDMKKTVLDLATKVNRPEAGEKAAPETERKNFFSFLRKGSLAPEEMKTLVVGTDSAGGYLAPTSYYAEIIKSVVEWSPVRQVARILPTSTKSSEFPKQTGNVTGSWTSEIGTRSEDTGLTFGLEEIPNHELTALVKVSRQQLEDSAFNLEAFLAQEFAEQLAKAEGTAFISGNGIGKPRGISYDTTNHTASGSAAALTAAGLVDCFYALADGYAKNATWLMRRATIGKIRALVSTTGEFLWTPGLNSTESPLLLGRPVLECADMPAVGAGAFPIVVGDFKRAYYISDRVGLEIQRLTELYAASGTVGFLARMRVGGQVVNTNALRFQEVAAS